MLQVLACPLLLKLRIKKQHTFAVPLLKIWEVTFLENLAVLAGALMQDRMNCCWVSRYVDQGGGKRKGAFAVYLEPWHSDIFEWLDLRKNHGKEEVSVNNHLWVGSMGYPYKVPCRPSRFVHFRSNGTALHAFLIHLRSP